MRKLESGMSVRLFAGVCVAVAAIMTIIGFSAGSIASSSDIENTREWISALSGWAAALGAGVAAYITINELRKQNGIVKEQTEHLLGNSPPEFVVTRKFGVRRLRLRVTNWNRRSIAIDGIDATSGGRPLDIEVMASDTERHFPAQKLRRIHLSGWSDRSGRPEIKNVYFHVPSLVCENGEDPLRREVVLSIRARLLGDAHETRIFTARAIDLS